MTKKQDEPLRTGQAYEAIWLYLRDMENAATERGDVEFALKMISAQMTIVGVAQELAEALK